MTNFYCQKIIPNDTHTRNMQFNSQEILGKLTCVPSTNNIFMVMDSFLILQDPWICNFKLKGLSWYFSHNRILDPQYLIWANFYCQKWVSDTSNTSNMQCQAQGPNFTFWQNRRRDTQWSILMNFHAQKWIRDLEFPHKSYVMVNQQSWKFSKNGLVDVQSFIRAIFRSQIIILYLI